MQHNPHFAVNMFALKSIALLSVVLGLTQAVESAKPRQDIQLLLICDGENLDGCLGLEVTPGVCCKSLQQRTRDSSNLAI
jgi:hypothetical protein